MSLTIQIQNLATRVASEFKTIRGLMTGSGTGDLSGLATTNKSSLVAAINEAAGSANIASASETVAGKVELATAAETTTGLDNTRAVHPAGLKVELDKKAAISSLAAVAFSGSASDIVTGTLPSSVLPPLAINETFVVASQAAMLALSAQRGDIAKRTDLNGQAFVLTADAPGTLANWVSLNTTSDVTTVNGQSGAVVLTKSDVGLANVDNTSDVNKPVSTAQQTALNNKQDKDATLTALAGVTTAADTVIYATGPDTFAVATLTPAGRALIDDIDASAQRATLAVYSTTEIGNPETDFVSTFNAGLV